MLISCLRFLAECPCVTCYIKKPFLSAMGTVANGYRKLKIRMDNTEVRKKIELARRKIFEGGRKASGSAIDSLLKSKSLLPHRVSHSYLGSDEYATLTTKWPKRARSLYAFKKSTRMSMCINSFAPTSCTNSNSASGKPFSHISFASFMHMVEILLRYSMHGP